MSHATAEIYLEREELASWLSGVFEGMSGRTMSPSMLDWYLAEMKDWRATGPELRRLEERLRRNCEKFPPLPVLLSHFNYVRFSRKQTDPQFITWKDESGRPYAQPSGERVESAPSNETIEKWRTEAVPSEDAKRIFVGEFVKSGGKIPEKSQIKKDLERITLEDAVRATEAEARVLPFPSESGDTADYDESTAEGSTDFNPDEW